MLNIRRLRAAFRLPALLLCVVWAIGSGAPAQAGFFERLLGGRLGSVQEGEYAAGEKIRFQIQRDGKNYLLRFDGDPEVFVLSSDHTSMGGRTLRYDSGEMALRVTGWGALTLYTDSEPDGLPAVRVSDAPVLSLSTMSLQDVQFIAAQAAAKFEHDRHLRLFFIVDWSVLETDANLRATASEAMQNVAKALDRFVTDARARKLVGTRLRRVTLATGTRSGLRLEAKTLVVTFNPEQGYSGCASSRAIWRDLPSVLNIAKKTSVSASR
ncbi:MAG: DUF4908 domain-containing protein [Alphaproteobacteria bacterium]|nr:DUF4908 domain-containing protein [Alphaproteobacteria bacterium]MBV9063457.1 DUF4908 domain-containing protein [Alphaproteobacteria bacterium]